jgi:uncharacterized protein YndB with AHSA1/START domain
MQIGMIVQTDGLDYTRVMKEMQFLIEIHAPKQKVWDTLWQDETFRQWASIIDPGTYMTGDLVQGNEVQFISAENGYGVTSLVDKVTVGEFLVLKHSADTQDTGKRERADEWTGGQERYELVENDGITTLTATFDVPLEMKEYFQASYPKALEMVKQLAEK